eukprot:jgi/Ulvmu1/7433/UM036_0094.1
MIFEKQLGIFPADWLRYEPLDQFLSINAVPVLAIEESVAQRSGLHVSLLRLIIATILSILAGTVHRYVPSVAGRHVYSFATGLALLYYPFGNQVVLTLVSCMMVYLAIRVTPRLAGKLSWTLSFIFMLVCMERTGDLWDTGAVDITGSLMVLVLKQVAIAHNISDGHSKRATSFTEERRSLLLESPPTLLQYLSFMYSFGNLLVGPFNEFADYSAFTKRTGPWKSAFAPGMTTPALAASGRCILQAVALLVVHLGVTTYFSPLLLTAPKVWEFSLLQRYLIAIVIAIGKRCQYYFIWGLSEAGLNAAGFGFNGFAGPDKKQGPLFDRYQNADPYQMETSTSVAITPRFWNINTGFFLRRYVYERFGGGVFGLATTQMVSGLWHGLREGHLLFFFSTIFLFQSSKVFYKQEQRLPPAVVQSPPWLVIKWILAHAPLSVLCQPFLTQRWELFWSTWRAFYFVPHAYVLGLCILGAVLPTPRKKKAA